jgi:hypothetical protein
MHVLPVIWKFNFCLVHYALTREYEYEELTIDQFRAGIDVEALRGVEACMITLEQI